MSNESDEYKVKFYVLFTSWKDEQPITKSGINFMERVLEDSGFTVENTVAKMLSMTGWKIDSKMLTYDRIEKEDWQNLALIGVKTIYVFEELEQYCESIKHRFASKKFGI